MSTFREFAVKVIEQTRDELQADGLVDDKAGVLAGAMVDAATIAVQEWLAAMSKDGIEERLTYLDGEYAFLIREAGKVTS